MPLATQFLATFTAAANVFGFQHGLIHAAVSRTPNFVVVMPATYTVCSFTYTFDSVFVSIFNPIAAVATMQVFVKRCHSIEDSAF